MNEANEFLDNFSSIKDQPDFWWQYSKFTKDIGNANIKKLVLNIPDVIVKIENDGAGYELYRHLLQACESNISFGKEIYEEIIQSECDKLLSLLHPIIAGVSKNDFNWAKEKVLFLIEDSNRYKRNQAITSVGLFIFPKNDSKNFAETIDQFFFKIINSEESDEILASVIFACRGQRKNLPNADRYILSLLQVDSSKVKIELLNVLTYNTKLELEQEFYEKILGSLVSLDLKFKLAYDRLAFSLKGHIANNLPTVKYFLYAWVFYNKENARNIKLLKPILVEIYKSKPIFFRKIITEWLNNDSSNFHIAIFALMREMNYQNVTSLKLDSELIQNYDFKDIEYITKKIIGYVFQHEISTSLIYSILEKRHKEEKVVLFLGSIFIDYLIFNYYSTIDFLKERKKEAEIPLKKVINKLIEEGEKYYSAHKNLEILKEFEPSESRLAYMNKIQNKKLNKSYDQNNEDRHSFLNMLTPLHLRAGKTAFGKFEDEYSAPMQPQLISRSAEMPRGEFIDPTGQALLRVKCQLFSRRQ